MELSYEETMRRIAEYEKNDPMEHKYCKENTFPWYVGIFKGEHQLFIVPYITTIGYYGTFMAWYRKLNDTELPEVIGEAILDAFEHIRVSPVDARTRAERDEDLFYLKETKCKSYRAFNKKYMHCGIHMNEQGIYSVSALISSDDNQGYGGIDGNETVKLPNNASSAALGNAVINAFRISEEYAKSQKPDPYPPKEVELLCGETVTVYPPRDRHFTDTGDGSAGEIYQVYEYAPSEGAETSAAFYLGIAAELDCDISEENIRKVWEKMYSSAETFSADKCGHGIFDLQVEMRNKNVHRISYLKQIDENELLECTMEVKSPNRRKKLDERLTALFEEFAGKITKK
ncbi:MAG: hypothetical protein NC253_00085 [Ruminococcus sp.]|nr:hypothetical protein [Ruminococcus sp.]MCM1478135.1 hypothetical protein [Muribaculaceae bacterium]